MIEIMDSLSFEQFNISQISYCPYFPRKNAEIQILLPLTLTMFRGSHITSADLYVLMVPLSNWAPTIDNGLVSGEKAADKNGFE